MPPVQTEQEIRFAVVLYGGVSLAVYINGVVQELFRLVRSTAGVPDLRGSELVYQKIGQMLAPEDWSPEKQPADTDPIKTKFRIDIISGTFGRRHQWHLSRQSAGDRG
jgi:hypothetical protein